MEAADIVDRLGACNQMGLLYQYNHSSVLEYQFPQLYREDGLRALPCYIDSTKQYSLCDVLIQCPEDDRCASRDTMVSVLESMYSRIHRLTRSQKLGRLDAN